MKKLEFAFHPSGLQAAVELLKTKEATPTFGQSDEDIASLIKKASVEAFNREYKDQEISSPMINGSGVVHGNIVWRGLVCLFSSPSLCNYPKEIYEVTVSEKSSPDVQIVAVDFLANLG
jgi:hypothetical protein